jgi:hypothetical protein
MWCGSGVQEGAWLQSQCSGLRPVHCQHASPRVTNGMLCVICCPALCTPQMSHLRCHERCVPAYCIMRRSLGVLEQLLLVCLSQSALHCCRRWWRLYGTGQTSRRMLLC